MITTVNDHRTFYAQLGEATAPPLILLHGASSTHTLWLPAARAIKAPRRILLPDLPAHGQSKGPALEGIPALGDFVLGFMDALDIEQAVVGGHSMGGAIALHLALHHPERLTGLIAVSTIARMRVNRHVLEVAAHDPEQLADFFEEYAYGPTADATLVEQGRAMLTTMRLPHAEDFAACNQFDVRENVHSVSLPTLIICGREDQMTPAKYARLMAEQMPHATLHIIDHGGHMLLVETPRHLAEHIDGWLMNQTK